MTQASDTVDRTRRWDTILVACLEAFERGQAPDRQALTAAHPEFADELAAFFAQRDRVQQITGPIRRIVQSAPIPIEVELLEDTVSDGVHSGPEVHIRSFGDYELQERLGRGGMGTVYRARQISRDRVVALKIIRSTRLGSVDQQRFRREAEFVAALDHPNIVPMYEVGDVAGQHYFAMKLIEGGSLTQWISDFRFQISDFSTSEQASVARLVSQVARAMHHAHQHGIIHRDLKPGNILLQISDCRFEIADLNLKSEISNLQSAIPLVADFGLAKRVAAESDLTQSGVLIGTPRYMAPEQTRGKRGAVATATDVYGLGVILYVLLTGHPPFRGKTVPETLHQVREQTPEPPQRVNPRVDPDLAALCLQCLQKDPLCRPVSAEAVADELQCWANGA